jgi:hypothetical protein
MPSGLCFQPWSTVTISPAVPGPTPNQSGLGLSTHCCAWTRRKVMFISRVRSAGGVILASLWSSLKHMSLRGHTSYHSAFLGTEQPSGWGKRPVTGMGGSPCGSGSPSPLYFGWSGNSTNWGVEIFMICTKIYVFYCTRLVSTVGCTHAPEQISIQTYP